VRLAVKTQNVYNLKESSRRKGDNPVSVFALEHFYYGQSVANNKPDSRPRLLAASPNITPELAQAAVERATLPPLIRSTNKSWALVRGSRQLPFLLIQAQIGNAGEILSHYILLPSEVLRALGGNLRAMLKLAEDSLPTFASNGGKLKPIEIKPAESETTQQQIDDLLDLMTIARDSLDTIEQLLAAIVQGKPIIVQGAPNDFEQRLDFIEGILALLPLSVRFAVTFATHTLPTTESDVQIRFYSDDLPPKDTLVYNWTTGRLIGETFNDDYSRFMISQLRLDPELVIERTRALTSTAGWRMKQGDKLADALSYASHRVKVDTALINNQPINKDDVANILAEDPTLNDSMRIAYARHLLTFSLAMDDVQHADPIAKLLASSSDLERATYRQMSDAIDDKQAATVYKMIDRWLSGDNRIEGENWVTLAYRAATTRIDQLVKAQNIDGINAFVQVLQQASPMMRLERLAPKVIEKILTFTSQDAPLAENVFLLGMAYMETPILRRLLELKPFMAQQRLPIRQVWAILSGAEVRNPPPGLLIGAARGFGENWEAVILVRFAELARQIGRFDLLDEPTLASIVQLALSPQGKVHHKRLLNISEPFGEYELTQLGAKGAQRLLEIRLARGDHAGLAAQMIQQSATLYKGDLQIEYIKMLERLFSEIPLTSDQVATAITQLAQQGIKSAPLAMATIGALQKRTRTPALDGVAKNLETLFGNEPRLLDVIPAQSILALLNYHIQNNAIEDAIRVAQLIASGASQSSEGLWVIGQIYRQMANNITTKAAALEIVRVYVRDAEDKAARQAIAYFGRELGGPVRNALEATYLVKQARNGQNLATYTKMIQRFANFLQDIATAYNDRNLPNLPDLINSLEMMPDSFSREEQRVFSRAMMNLLRGMITVAQAQKAQRGNADRLISGNADATNGLDLLRVMSGHFTGGKKLELRLKTINVIVDPVGGRTRRSLRDDVIAGNEVLAGLARGYPAETKVEIKTELIREELTSLIKELNEAEQREVNRNLGPELQKLVDVIGVIVEKGDVKVLDDAGLGGRIDTLKQRPRTALEYLRFLYGYHQKS
jgi:hypothetical protein